MTWLLIIGTAWMVLAAPLAMVIGRAIRLSDRMEPTGPSSRVPDFVPEDWTTFPASTR